jgi:hypothetical protein
VIGIKNGSLEKVSGQFSWAMYTPSLTAGAKLHGHQRVFIGMDKRYCFNRFAFQGELGAQNAFPQGKFLADRFTLIQGQIVPCPPAKADTNTSPHSAIVRTQGKCVIRRGILVIKSL